MHALWLETVHPQAFCHSLSLNYVLAGQTTLFSCVRPSKEGSEDNTNMYYEKIRHALLLSLYGYPDGTLISGSQVPNTPELEKKNAKLVKIFQNLLETRMNSVILVWKVSRMNDFHSNLRRNTKSTLHKCYYSHFL